MDIMNNTGNLDAHDLLFSISNNGLYMSPEEIRRRLGVDEVELWYNGERLVDVVRYDDGRSVMTGFKVPMIRCRRGDRTLVGVMPIVRTARRFTVDPKAFRKAAMLRPEFGNTSMKRASKANKVLRNLEKLHSISVGSGFHPFVDWVETVKSWRELVDEAFENIADQNIEMFPFPEPDAPVQ